MQNSLTASWSIIIPAYNEARRLPNTLRRLDAYARMHPGGELVVVDDGSLDGTYQVVTDYRFESSLSVEVIRFKENLGKGAAVRAGIQRAQGDWIAYIDADGSIDIQEIERLLPYLIDAPIVIGSKYLHPLGDTRYQELSRSIIAKVGNLAVRCLFGLRFKDTQCGFKVLKKRVAKKLFGQMVINRWGFDVELLVLAKRFGYEVIEVPIRWSNTDDSRVSALPAARTTLAELGLIRWNLWFKRYSGKE